MKTVRSPVWTGALGLMLAMGLGACSGNNGGGTAPSPTPATTPTPTPPPGDGGSPLDLLFEQLAEACTADPLIEQDPTPLSACLATGLQAFCDAADPEGETLPICGDGGFTPPTSPEDLLALLAPITDQIGEFCTADPLVPDDPTPLSSCLATGLEAFCDAADPEGTTFPFCGDGEFEPPTSPEDLLALLSPITDQISEFCTAESPIGTDPTGLTNCLATGLEAFCDAADPEGTTFPFCGEGGIEPPDSPEDLLALLAPITEAIETFCTEASPIEEDPTGLTRCLATGLAQFCALPGADQTPICGEFTPPTDPEDLLLLLAPVTDAIAMFCGTEGGIEGDPIGLSNCLAAGLAQFCQAPGADQLPICGEGGLEPPDSPEDLLALLAPVTDAIGEFCGEDGGIDGDPTGFSNCLAAGLAQFCQAPGADQLPFCDEGGITPPSGPEDLLALLAPLTDAIAEFCGEEGGVEGDPTGLSNCLAAGLGQFCQAPGADALPVCEDGGITPPTDPADLLALLAPLTDAIGEFCGTEGGIEGDPTGFSNCLAAGLAQLCQAPGADQLPFCGEGGITPPTSPEDLLALLAPVTDAIGAFCGDEGGIDGDPTGLSTCLAAGLTQFCAAPGADQLPFCGEGGISPPTSPEDLLALLAPVTEAIETFCTEAPLIPGDPTGLSSCLATGLAQFCQAPGADQLPFCDADGGVPVPSDPADLLALLAPVTEAIAGFCDADPAIPQDPTGLSNCLTAGLETFCDTPGADALPVCGGDGEVPSLDPSLLTDALCGIPGTEALPLCTEGGVPELDPDLLTGALCAIPGVSLLPLCTAAP